MDSGLRRNDERADRRYNTREMNPIEKIDRSHRQGLVLHGFCLTVFFVFVFINNNLPLIAQTFAHFTYIPVELEDSYASLECTYSPNNLCWREPWWWMYQRNTAHDECTQFVPKHRYKIDEREYNLQLSTYTYELPCKLEKTIFVSPLNPSWAVADNRLPSSETVEMLFDDCIKILLCLGLFISLSCAFLSCRPVRILAALHTETRKMNVLNSLILPYYAAATAQMIQYMYEYAFDPEEMAYHGFLTGGWPVLVGIVIYAIYSPREYIILTPVLYILLSQLLPFIFYFALDPTIEVLPISPSDPIISGFAYLILHLIIILAITTYSRLRAAQRT